MKRRTKIVCTLGPATAGREAEMAAAGMNVARLNCGHGDWPTRAKWVAAARAAARKEPIGVLVDLEGPKFRIGILPEPLDLQSGDEIEIGPKGAIPLNQGEIMSVMTAGDRVLFGDGTVAAKVIGTGKGVARLKVVSGGLLKSRHGVTLAGRSFEAQAITAKDRQDIADAAKIGVDFIALSYVKQAFDMLVLRRIVDEHDRKIRLVAKIETKEALRDLDAIIAASDAVMVARGDLGLQMEIEDVPAAQKRIIARCNQAGKPVITATQMLESMMTCPRPTRAEASDVANAILDGTDAVMLSGETASGQFPLEAVRTMAKIAEKTEPMTTIDRRPADQRSARAADSPTDSVAMAAVRLAHSLKARAIVTTSTSGTTPRMVSKHRPDVPILCACWDDRVLGHLALVWGVQAAVIPLPKGTDSAVAAAVWEFVKRKRLKAGDRVVVTAGVPPGAAGNTNMILVHTV